MQDEYFVLERAGPNTYPLLGWDQSASMFRKGKPVDEAEPVRLRLAEPVPPAPVMVDHHSLPEPVVSTRVYEVLAPLRIYGVQWVPADVRVGGEALRYWLLHVHNRVACLDPKQSVFKRSRSGLLLVSLDALVLDEEVLAGIPLEQRLVFVLAESTSVHLFHRIVVDRVMRLTPPAEGLRFIPVPEWNDASGFR